MYIRPTATRTIVFPSQVTGTQLIIAVKAIIDSNTQESDSAALYYIPALVKGKDYMALGQISDLPHEHVHVAPKASSLGIHRRDTYHRINVMSVDWFDASANESDPKLHTVTVQRFADRLRHQLTTPSDQLALGVWPQDITVCKECESIVDLWHADFNYRCPTHGANVAVKYLAVIPASA